HRETDAGKTGAAKLTPGKQPRKTRQDEADGRIRRGSAEQGGKGAMTETVSGPTARKGRRGKGLKVRRINTTAGVHPYEQVSWERRDVVMTNWRDGTVNFEQRGVEFPDFWSVNAAKIVTSKYFRGAVGSPERESSLRQLIDRVVNAYRRSGEANGYFAGTEDAEIFEQE